MALNFVGFKAMVEAAGMEAVDCGKFHWRIVGGLVAVNWYPASKRRTVYCNGASGRTSFSGTAEEAIAAALGEARTMEPGAVKAVKRRFRTVEKVKKKWWNDGRRSCHWCKLKFKDRREMTADHVVPLFRGGLDHELNMVPACSPCNKARGHDITKKDA